MPLDRRAILAVALGLAAGTRPAAAQPGYPPPMPGMAPPGPGDAQRHHFETLRQQDIQRQQRDSFQRDQQIQRERNLDTLRRQQDDQRRSLDAARREQLERERRLSIQRGSQVQGRRPAAPIDPATRERIDRAARPSGNRSDFGILAEDPPRRRRRRPRHRAAPR